MTQVLKKQYGSNAVRRHNEYAAISIPPDVMNDLDEVEIGDELEFVGLKESDGNTTLVLEPVEGGSRSE